MAKSFNAQMADRFRKITADYNTINLYIHETGMMILRHSMEHGDCSTAQGLINAMPQSARKAALIKWFSVYSPIVVKDSDKWVAKMHKEGSKLYVPFNIEEAEANPWFSVAEGMGAEKSYDFAELLKMVERLASSIEKKIEDGKVPPEDMERATLLSGALKRVNVPAVSFKGEIGIKKADNTQEGEEVVTLLKQA